MNCRSNGYEIRSLSIHISICVLQDNVSLKKLILSYNGIGNKGCEATSIALSSNRTLLELDIASNRISDDGLAFLAKCLRHNDTLKILKVAWSIILCINYQFDLPCSIWYMIMIDYIYKRVSFSWGEKIWGYEKRMKIFFLRLATLSDQPFERLWLHHFWHQICRWQVSS